MPQRITTCATYIERIHVVSTCVVPLIYVIGILGVAGSAAASITSEHEEDTWVSLTATDLTGREIVFAKMLGAMKRRRHARRGDRLLGDHRGPRGIDQPLSIPCLIVALGVYAWFAAALGVWISLQLRSTWRAQFLTMACLLLINVFGQGLLNSCSRCSATLPSSGRGLLPHEISKLLMDPSVPRAYLARRIGPGPGGSRPWMTATSGRPSSAWRASWPTPRFAAFLTWHTLHRFEIVAGRARRAKRHLLPHPLHILITTMPIPPAIGTSLANARQCLMPWTVICSADRFPADSPNFSSPPVDLRRRVGQSRSVRESSWPALTWRRGWAMVLSPAGIAGWGSRTERAGRPTMAMITDASLASEIEVEGLAFARSASNRGRGHRAGSRSPWRFDCPRGRPDSSLVGQRDRHGDGQSGLGRPEAGGDARIDRYPGVSAPSGRGGPWRPGPDPRRRHRDRAFPER